MGPKYLIIHRALELAKHYLDGILLSAAHALEGSYLLLKEMLVWSVVSEGSSDPFPGFAVILIAVQSVYTYLLIPNFRCGENNKFKIKLATYRTFWKLSAVLAMPGIWQRAGFIKLWSYNTQTRSRDTSIYLEYPTSFSICYISSIMRRIL